MTDSLIPSPSQLFFSKNDPKDQRLGELIKPLKDAPKNGYTITGYPDDEGIKLNGGRLGAHLGPAAVRKNLYKMTPHPYIPFKQTYDLGDISPDLNMAQKHSLAQKHTEKLLSLGNKTISIGGGHDYGFPDAAAFLEYCKKENTARPLVINFDAHLDVRPLDKGLSSGTPFYRLLKDYDNFDFAEIGIQYQCNSKDHLEWCLAQGAKVLSLEDIMISGLSFTEKCCQFLDEWLIKKRPCFISLDIDAFASSFAMGCSQSWPTGLDPQNFFPFFEILLARMDVLGLGVYEVSPPLDLDDRTSRLAAQIIYKYLFQS